MHEIHLQLTEQLYNQAKRWAVEAGFDTVDEYIVDVVSEDAAQETTDLDYRFTPQVMTHLNQIQEAIKAGSKTYSEEELDDSLQDRTREWRESHAS